MLAKYQQSFRNLDDDMARHVWEMVRRRHDDFPEPPLDANGGRLFQVAGEAGLDQADVIMAMSVDTTMIGLRATEVLIGRAIQRRAPPPDQRTVDKAKAKAKAVQRAGQRTDTRVIDSVAPNPKKPGSAAHARYEHYEVGLTVNQCLERGLTVADVKYDESKGFITLRAGR